jgi:predicted nuclease with TOPRIM domain
MNNRLTNLEVGQARLEEKIDSLEKDIESVKEDTKELKVLRYLLWFDRVA